MYTTHRVPFESLEPRTLFTAFVVDTTQLLQEAIIAANAHPGKDVIVLQADVSTTSSLEITDDLRIVGTSESRTIDAGGAARVLSVSGASLELNKVSIIGGSAAEGGGIWANNATLLIEDSAVVGNHVVNADGTGRGGGVYALNSTVSVIDSSFTGNTASGSVQARGGAIYVESSSLSVTGSQFVENSVAGTTSDGQGGAISAVNAAAMITTSTFLKNQATSALGAGGGAIAIDSIGLTSPKSNLLVSDSLFDQNSVTAATALGGGAIVGYMSDTVHVVNSVLQNNSVAASGVIAEGGGIYLSSTNGIIEGATIVGNTATAPLVARGGGIAFLGFMNTLTIRDSVITGNTAATTFNPAGSYGGGVSIDFGTASVDDDTIITGNHAVNGPDVYGTLPIIQD